MALIPRPITTTSANFFLPLALPPAAPDYHICDALYGQNLAALDCIRAALSLPEGTTRIPFWINQPQQRYSLPITIQSGDCVLTVEVAGPAADPRNLGLMPNTLRTLASWVLQKCIIQENGVGGFVTFAVSNVLRYVSNPLRCLDVPFPTCTIFITLSITTKPLAALYPGDYDPSIPLLFKRWNDYYSGSSSPNTELRTLYTHVSELWGYIGTILQRGRTTTTWWEHLR